MSIDSQYREEYETMCPDMKSPSKRWQGFVCSGSEVKLVFLEFCGIYSTFVSGRLTSKCLPYRRRDNDII